MFDIETFVQTSARILEVGGVLTTLGGALVALYLSLGERAQGGAAVYRVFRQRLGRAILLGLELLVAADIVRTVSDMPTLDNALVLGLIVLIRSFLSFALQVELEGRLPWAGKAASSALHPRPQEKEE